MKLEFLYPYRRDFLFFEKEREKDFWLMSIQIMRFFIKVRLM
jgi:hypothetical protein